MISPARHLFLNEGPPRALSPATLVLANLVVAAFYTATGYAGLSLAFVGSSITLFWPPSGLAFTALWIGGGRLLPGVALGAVVVNIVTAGSVQFAMIAMVGNTASAWLAVAIMRRALQRRPDAGELMRVLWFLLIAVLGCTLVSATLGTFAVARLGLASSLQSSWVIWWMGDAMGVLIAAPPLLLWRRILQESWAGRDLLDALGFAAIAAGITAGLALVHDPIWAVELFKLFTLLLSLWAGARFGLTGPAIVTLLMTFVAVAVTISGVGPFTRGTFFDNFALVHSYLFAEAVAGMLLAAAISDLRRVLARERRALDDAKIESDNRIQMLTMISHDLRTPLSGIMGILQTLQRSDAPSEDRRLVEVGLRAGESMTTLVSNIIDVARLDLVAITLDPAPFDPARVIGDVIDVHRHRAAAKGLTLTLRLDPTLPAWLIGDRVRVEQLIGNLVANAIAYTDRGGVTLGASWRGLLAVQVADTGPGVDEAAQARIFEPFVRVDPAGSAGLGLGLYICRHLAELMGGQVFYRRGVDTGSCFRVELPLPTGAAERPALPAAVVTDPPLTVLLIEDDEIARAATTALLSSRGHRVVAIDDGDDAPTLLADTRFDLVLLDIRMATGALAGLAVARAIRALPCPTGEIAIVALTGDAAAGQRDAYRAAGIDGVLVKPLSLEGGLAAQVAAARAKNGGGATADAAPTSR